MSAKFITETKETTKLVEVKEKATENVGVQLDLTLEEAQVIVEVFAMISGSMDCTARKHTRTVSDKLWKLGLYFTQIDVTKGSLCFSDNSLSMIAASVEKYKKSRPGTV